jgi:NAD(P)-dependent dehydrogenase (short-subunit alcohol dehydrogenase family)
MGATEVDGNRRLEGKVALVTGAGSGIGAGVARRYGREGAAVVCVDLHADTAEKTAAAIADAGGTSSALGCDVSDAALVEAMVGEAISTSGGRVDVVANVAGIGNFNHSHSMPVAEWDKMLAVNLHGSFYVCRFVLPHLLEQGGGAIINTASTAGVMGQPYSAAYCASKGGVVMLTKALAEEYKDRNVRVNAVAPGGVDTPIIEGFSSVPEGGDMRRIRKMMTPMGFTTPDEIASLFAYLACDEARYMTGAIVAYDGGITA